MLSSGPRLQVIAGVNPEQQLVKVVYDELLQLLGAERADLVTPASGPKVILLAGLQGVGKTTAAGKLAKLLQADGGRVLLASTDVYRPAAIDQLEMLAGKVEAGFVRLPEDLTPPEMAALALRHALAEGYDSLVVDTAGRLQVRAALLDGRRHTQQFALFFGSVTWKRVPTNSQGGAVAAACSLQKLLL